MGNVSDRNSVQLSQPCYGASRILRKAFCGQVSNTLPADWIRKLLERKSARHVTGAMTKNTAWIIRAIMVRGVDLQRFCAGLLSHYATLASNASGLMPPRYEWRRRVL